VGDGLRPPPGQASRKVPRGLEDRFPSRRQQRQSSANIFRRKKNLRGGLIIFWSSSAKPAFNPPMGLLNMFRKEASAPQVEPQLTDAERSDSLREQLHDVQKRMAVLNDEMRDFRTLHQLRVDGLMQIVGMKTESLGGWPSVETAWRILVRRRDVLTREFHRINAMGAPYWSKHV
jgi:hypothetical protein